MRAPVRPLAALALALACGAATAAEFRNVGVPVAVLYDGPSLQARKLHLAPRGMPLEVLARPDAAWVKARDVSGDQFFVVARDLADPRQVITAALATVRQAPTDAAPVLVRLERGVLLDTVAPPAEGWLAVRLRDGAAGHVRLSEVWGR